MTDIVSRLRSYSLPGGFNPPQFSPSGGFTLQLKVYQQAFWALPFFGTIQFGQGCFDMAKKFCQEGDIGFPLIIQVLDEDGNPVDLTGASDIKFILEYPDRNSRTREASLFTDGTDGKVLYTTVESDLTQSGLYFVQVRYSLESEILFTEVGALQVFPNIPPHTPSAGELIGIAGGLTYP